ncbi:MAG: Fpg/Nei family DNA glycosylase [Actinomycetota bacterium]|nr:Fpg/Nei family DNA glycosylase [Actinomycetota bacterium]
MPEGHTLHGLARDQTEHFAGKPVRVTSPQGRFADGAALVDGKILDEVTAHGKHLFAAFGEQIVHVHLGLFGRYVAGVGEPPEARGAVRMRWVVDGSWTDLRGATACELLTPGEATALVARLGPDPLRRRTSGDAAFARISRSRAPIAGLLMDQSVLSGVGNVYRAEILFRHRIPPHLPGRDLTREAWSALWRDLVTLMRAGLRTGRIVTTLPIDRAHPRGYVRHEDAHYVYRRTGLPCRVCGTPVTMQMLQARKLYWCPSCQA